MQERVAVDSPRRTAYPALLHLSARANGTGEPRMTLQEGLDSERRRARLAKVTLAVFALASIISLLSSLGQLDYLDGIESFGRLSPRERDFLDPWHVGIPRPVNPRQPLTGLLPIVVFVPTGVIWLIWLHRAFSNLRLMGEVKTKFTANSAVQYWFLPLFNLFRPYQVMRELWVRSADHHAGAAVPHRSPPLLLPSWWAICLLCLFLEVHQMRLFFEQADRREFAREFAQAVVFHDMARIVSAVLSLILVWRIDSLQNDAPLGSARLSSGPRPTPS